MNKTDSHTDNIQADSAEIHTDGNSRWVNSNQDGMHPDLDEIVLKYAESDFRRPISEHTQHAFDGIQKRVAIDGRALILDSGCGVGESTVHLSTAHPDYLVVGVDQSEHRLSKNPHYNGVSDVSGEHGNILLVRADCVDFWRLAQQADWQLAQHTVFYPNPWPKKQHLKRRWHGHPVLGQMLALGGTLELRSNWKTYLDEFARALYLYQIDSKLNEMVDISNFITPFERKYAQSGQPLYRLISQLP